MRCIAMQCNAGIKVLEAIDITDKNEVFAGNMLAFVTVHQHAGLAFLMLKRYKDAARILNEVGGGGGGSGGVGCVLSCLGAGCVVLRWSRVLSCLLMGTSRGLLCDGFRCSPRRLNSLFSSGVHLRCCRSCCTL